MQRVSRYDGTGYVGDLPELNEGRNKHGCGAFLSQDGTKASTGCLTLFVHQLVKAFLVAGWTDDYDAYLSFTELLVEDSDAWTMSTTLPRALYSVSGVTLGNIVYMT